MDPAVATIIGVIIGGGIAVLGSRHAVNHQSRRNAEQTFSDSIHEILIGMYPDPIDWPKDSWRVLNDKMSNMQCAVQKITFHLNPTEVTRINTAWNDYKKYCNTINDDGIKARPIYPTILSVDQVAVFKNKVERLLAYKNA